MRLNDMNMNMWVVRVVGKGKEVELHTLTAERIQHLLQLLSPLSRIIRIWLSKSIV